MAVEFSEECEVHTQMDRWYSRRPSKDQVAYVKAASIGLSLQMSSTYGREFVAQRRYRRAVMQLQAVAAELDRAHLLFESYARKWKHETRHFSSITQVVLHPSYQRIIGLGPRAIPMILSDLEKAPDHWFWALAALSGENPVSVEDEGNVAAMRLAWLSWGRDKGYL